MLPSGAAVPMATQDSPMEQLRTLLQVGKGGWAMGALGHALSDFESLCTVWMDLERNTKLLLSARMEKCRQAPAHASGN